MSAPWTRRLRGLLQRSVPMMITCRELEEFIDGYLDATLPWRQRLVFRTHLFLCRECRDYLAKYSKAIDLGKAVFEHPDEPAPSEIPDDLVRAILAARRASDE